jgi:hypothetical protein
MPQQRDATAEEAPQRAGFKYCRSLRLPLLVVPNRPVAEKLGVGINLTTIETLPIYLVEKALAGEDVEPGLTAVNDGIALLRSIANPEIRVIVAVAEYGYRIVTRRSAGVRTAMDLRGKKIATSLNSSAHFYIVKTLQSVGLAEPDDHRRRHDAAANAGGARAW